MEERQKEIMKLMNSSICKSIDLMGINVSEEEATRNQYTAIVRKRRLEYVEICLELNASVRGKDLPSIEKNLRNAIELYLEDIKDHPETSASPISTEEFIEFLKDTEPERYREPLEDLLLRPFEVHEVPSYA